MRGWESIKKCQNRMSVVAVTAPRAAIGLAQGELVNARLLCEVPGRGPGARVLPGRLEEAPALAWSVTGPEEHLPAAGVPSAPPESRVFAQEPGVRGLPQREACGYAVQGLLLLGGPSCRRRRCCCRQPSGVIPAARGAGAPLVATAPKELHSESRPQYSIYQDASIFCVILQLAEPGARFLLISKKAHTYSQRTPPSIPRRALRQSSWELCPRHCRPGLSIRNPRSGVSPT